VALYRRTGSTRLLVISLVMLSLLTITVDYRGGDAGPLASAGRGALAVVGALQSSVRKVAHPIASFFSGLAHVGSLEAENDRLRDRVRELEQQAARSISVERERDRLMALFQLQAALGLKGVAAVVIGQSVNNFEWSVTINRGSSDGIEQHMPVISGEGLVGHVTEVTSNTSKVLMIVDPKSRVASRLAQSGETGLLIGQTQKQDLRLELFERQVDVVPNEIVETSGYQVPGGGEPLYPPGILIGFVSRATSQPGTLLPLLTVRPAVDFSSLEFVEVVTGQV
jgi:rod shape-determining protein MreC